MTRGRDLLLRLHKRNYRLDNGDCTNDDQFKVLAFDVKEENDQILVLLPPADDLDAMIGSAKCKPFRHFVCVSADQQGMVKKATAEALGRNQATAIEIVEPSGALTEPHREETGDGCATTGACGGSKLEW